MARPPTLGGPQSTPPVPKRGGFRVLFDHLTALSTVNKITIYFDPASIGVEVQAQFAHLPSIFSSALRPVRFDDYYNLGMFYNGRGGRLIQSDTTVERLSSTTQEHADQGLKLAGGYPANNYNSPKGFPSDRKRRHSSDPLPCYIDQDGINKSSPSVDLASGFKTPAQPPTPSDRKRQRASEPPSLETFQDLVLAFRNLEERQTPFLEDLLDAARGFRKMVDENQRLVHRVKELEDQHTAILERVAHEAKRTAKLETRMKEFNARLNNQTDCRYDSDEEHHLLRRIDKSVARAFHAACDDKRGKEQMAKEVVEEVTRLMIDADGNQVGTSLRATRSHSNPLSVETSLYVAVQDIQATYCPSLMAADSYEMVWLMEYLRDNPMSAVMYHASGSVTRLELVKKWKAKAEDCRRRPRE